jgi:hypothetical protein
MRAAVFWLTLALNLLVLNGLIAHKHKLLHGNESQTIRLKLESHIQSWHRRENNKFDLYFEMVENISPAPYASRPSARALSFQQLGSSGCLVVRLDEIGRAHV